MEGWGVDRFIGVEYEYTCGFVLHNVLFITYGDPNIVAYEENAVKRELNTVGYDLLISGRASKLFGPYLINENDDLVCLDGR